MTLSMSHAIIGSFQAAAVPTWPAVMTGISTLVIAVVMLVLVAVLVVAGLKLRRLSVQMDTMLTRMSGEVTPIMHRLQSIADSADRIAGSVRTDVDRLSGTINGANDALQDAVTLAERRLKEFDALVRVVQREAEDAVVSAAATVRGVRAVATAIGEETAAALAFSDEDSEEEIDDGDESGDTAEQREPEPRIRRAVERRRGVRR